MNKIFKALGDRNRLRIVLSLITKSELCACQIHEWLGVSAPTASNHLNILIDTGLILSRKEGRWVYYTLNQKDASLSPLFKWLKLKLYHDESLKFDVLHFLTLLKPLQHRAYSIASSNLIFKNSVHLTVSTQRWQRKTRDYGGVCSTFLSDSCELGDKVKIFLIPNKLFKLPDDQNKPIIMIGPGTGVAPFLSFIQERKYLKSNGKNWLFFGAQTKKNDFIYEDQISNFVEEKILNNLDTAFSRDQDNKIYVQDKIYERSNEFFQWLKNGAIIYVCGDAQKMAKDVEVTIIKLISKELKCEDKKALEYLKMLKKEKRYLIDVY